MDRARLDPQTGLLLIIDLQSAFAKSIFEWNRVVSRSLFLAKSARCLEVPVIASAQSPDKLGPVCDDFLELSDHQMSKNAFSCWNDPLIQRAIKNSDRSQVVICGLETHICVAQTALDLSEAGFQVFVCPDAVSASNQERHKLGMERIRDGGILPTHSEAVVYEWLGTANHKAFPAILRLVKEYQSI